MPRREPKTVLVVDDEPDILDLVRMVLEDEGHRVMTARNGKEALDLISDRMPDLILLDMKMPVMDGWEFVRRFRDLYERRVPIIVLTAAADASRRAMQVGADGYVGKPFDVRHLAVVVVSHLPR